MWASYKRSLGQLRWTFSEIRLGWACKLNSQSSWIIFLRVVQRGVQTQNFEVRFFALWLRFHDDSYLDRLKIHWRLTSFNFRVGLCRIRLSPRLISKWNGLPSELPLTTNVLLLTVRSHSFMTAHAFWDRPRILRPPTFIFFKYRRTFEDRPLSSLFDHPGTF